VSADPPPPASDAGHPLHSILSGFTEADDDVLADFERGDGATVEPGPLRPPSAERPGDDTLDQPFTPPIPPAPVQQLVDDARHAVSSRPRSAAADALRASVPRLPRPPLKVALPLVAVVVVVAAGSSRDGAPPTPSRGDGRPAAATDMYRSSPVASGARRRGRARDARRRRRAVRAVRRTFRAAPRTPAVSMPQPLRAPAAAAASPHTPMAAAPADQFTTEFTP
jgi:hypothetical protein